MSLAFPSCLTKLYRAHLDPLVSARTLDIPIQDQHQRAAHERPATVEPVTSLDVGPIGHVARMHCEQAGLNREAGDGSDLAMSAAGTINRYNTKTCLAEDRRGTVLTWYTIWARPLMTPAI
jgi:hypothetical protein